MTSNLKVYAIGASRNIGYYASIRLLQKGATVTFLLRKEHVFDGDATMQPFIESGRARLVQGDALNKDDVQRGWERAAEPAFEGDATSVDVLLFTVGGTPTFHLIKGMLITPPDLVTHALFNTLTTLPSPPPSRIIAVTSTGLSSASHNALPLPMRPVYSYLLGPAHADKIGAEALLARASGSVAPAKAPENILQKGWEDTFNVPAGALAEKVVVVRPAMLTDGKCVADTDPKAGKPPYRVRAEGDLPVQGGYTISRRDTAHFVAERLLGDEWDTWKGKGVALAY
ncbi:hypothetical protein K488DRAFT_42793 [Vararia minispora EC-137]|uniref:Uncharacterized protein n=1 Tax=Vararia minispora EC-137 TaxID=1314806 RepID=A0ACB8QVU7_9AGAM|nr:hypothetical protein K488DRAFT_42793 [Vararia minispora EC-137]